MNPEERKVLERVASLVGEDMFLTYALVRMVRILVEVDTPEAPKLARDFFTECLSIRREVEADSFKPVERAVPAVTPTPDQPESFCPKCRNAKPYISGTAITCVDCGNVVTVEFFP